VKVARFFETSGEATQIRGAATQKTWFRNNEAVETSYRRSLFVENIDFRLFYRLSLLCLVNA
jgi:hypothetical protein